MQVTRKTHKEIDRKFTNYKHKSNKIICEFAVAIFRT
jgi:hypothetical protein